MAKAGHAMVSKKRPDVQIVGDELHPLGKIKDFAPYVAKIKAVEADTVLTGNWGNDMTLLVKAARFNRTRRSKKSSLVPTSKVASFSGVNARTSGRGDTVRPLKPPP